MSNTLTQYELSRQFFDWAFENPHLVKPTHIAVYFFAMEHCNRLGWKEKFGLPTTMSMEAIGIKSYNTYKQSFDDLVEWGFFKVVQKATNQYSAVIIALSKFNKAHNKAYDKALTKHGTKHTTKHSESTQQSIDSIDKPITNNIITNNNITENQKEILFTDFWKAYQKAEGKIEAEKKWDKLTKQEKEAVMAHVPKYIQQTPDKKFRKHASSYLNQKTFLDEIESETEKPKTTFIEQSNGGFKLSKS